ncbi:MAG: vitamin B12 dependent-methionine synthase activation domain-containing protein, partial [Rikenellaceae bacterium]
ICCYALSAGVGLDKLCEETDLETKGLYEQIATVLCGAFVERIHSFVRRQMWGYEKVKALSTNDILLHNFQGARFEVGSSELPSPQLRSDIFSLMGVEMTTYIKLDDDYNITPKGSACGIILSKSVKVKKEIE